MDKPNITEGEWEIIDIGERFQISVKDGEYWKQVCSVYKREEGRNNAKAIISVSDLLKIGIKIYKKLVSETDSVTAFDQEELKQALLKAGCANG